MTKIKRQTKEKRCLIGAKRIKKEIQDFVDSLTETANSKSYISKECVLAFAEDYLSNYNDPEYDPTAKSNSFVYLSAENGQCWLSKIEIKKGKVCKIRNVALVSYLNNEMNKIIRTGSYTFSECNEAI